MTDKPTFITPPNNLKAKVGEGGIPAYLIKQCQDYLESNPVDFTPYAGIYLSQIIAIKETLNDQPSYSNAPIIAIGNLVMQLKSNGSMFHYQLLSMVSDVMLRFLEKATQSDSDFIDILETYIKVISVILNKKLLGNGGNEGYLLTQELHNACLRYYRKYNIS